MIGHNDPSTQDYEHGTAYARQIFSEAGSADLVEAWGYIQGRVDAGYAEHGLALAYAYWLANTPLAKRAQYPFHNDCGEGHDPTKISCDQVLEFIEADRAVYPG